MRWEDGAAQEIAVGGAKRDDHVGGQGGGEGDAGGGGGRSADCCPACAVAPQPLEAQSLHRTSLQVYMLHHEAQLVTAVVGERPLQPWSAPHSPQFGS